MAAIMEWLAANWMTIAAVFVPAILAKLNVKVPVIVPNQPAPTPAIPLAGGKLPPFPTTMGHGEIVQWLLQVGQIELAQQVLAQGLKSGAIAPEPTKQ